MKKLILTCFIISICIGAIKAQITFEKTYGTNAIEKAKSVQQTPDGGYVIGGTDLVKVDSLGVEEWTQPYFSMYANTTFDGGYILIYHNGNSISFTKVKQDGTTEWQTYYSGGHWANEGEYIEEVDDGYIVTGRYQSVTGSGMLLLKLNHQGNTVWRRAFTGATSAGFNYGFSAQQTQDKGYIVTGYANIDYYDSTRHRDVFIVKTDTAGVEQWRKLFGGVEDDVAMSIRQDNSGNYFIGGSTKSYGNSSNMYLIKLDTAGNELWTKIYGGSLEEEATGLWTTNDGGCILVGKSNSFSNGDFDGYIVKTDANGDTIWTRLYEGIGMEAINSVQETSDNGYIMAGYTNSKGAGDFDMLLLKMDTFGNINYSTSTIPKKIEHTLKYNIYPNPSQGLFSIESDVAIRQIEIFNALGVMIYSANVHTKKTTFYLINQSKGIYFYRLKFGDEEIIETGKIMIE